MPQPTKVLRDRSLECFAGTKDGITLDERCAELKARMLAERTTGGIGRYWQRLRGLVRPTPQPSDYEPTHSRPKFRRLNFAILTLSLRPHSALKRRSWEYGKMQFRRGGYVDVRVSAR